ncbi:MAG: hypothetical protein U5Q03_10370 [Bacteroidota bacterium]|nr:hypothetical protein [Bacteroidota bacterium]
MKKDEKSLTKNLVIAILTLFTVGAVIFAYIQREERQAFMSEVKEVKKESQQTILDIYQKIERNLAEIREHEDLIRNTIDTRAKEGKINPEERINKQIELIEQIMQENRTLIASLNKEMNVKDEKLDEYIRREKNLQVRVDEYKTIMEDLNEKNLALQNDLEATQFEKETLELTVENLDAEIAQNVALIRNQHQQLSQKENELHTVYYAVDTYKELEEKALVEKEGGILGIAAVKTLTEDLDPSVLNRIDSRLVTEIPVWARKADVITNQHPDTYTIESNGDLIERIIIEDPEQVLGKQ